MKAYAEDTGRMETSEASGISTFKDLDDYIW